MLIFAACDVARRQGTMHAEGIQPTLHDIIWRIVSFTCNQAIHFLCEHACVTGLNRISNYSGWLLGDAITPNRPDGQNLAWRYWASARLWHENEHRYVKDAQRRICSMLHAPFHASCALHLSQQHIKLLCRQGCRISAGGFA